MKRKIIYLALLILSICKPNVALCQLSYQKEGDSYSLVELNELERILDKCQSELGIGSALNYLSNGAWSIFGGGKNSTGGDSLVFFPKADFEQSDKFFAFIMDVRYAVSAPNIRESLLKDMWTSEYIFQFNFPNVYYKELIHKELIYNGYKKTKEETTSNYTVVSYERGDYLAQLASFKNGKETVYVYILSNNVFN